ncbi:complement C5-like [Equus quagga]|uniref:complement C5-like n=1 Tax=Equus quagga TaxID=89248 RepID=UPI001EE2357B|nr:complement C5-like [Equus quagga]
MVQNSDGGLNISLLAPVQKNVLQQQIQPKDLSGGRNAVSHVYLEVVSAHFSKAAKIPLCYDNGFLFIQTDKSVYNSDQSGSRRVRGCRGWKKKLYRSYQFS